MTVQVGVLGGGRLATALSMLMHLGGAKVRVWEVDESRRPALKKDLKKAAVLVDTLEEAVDGAALVFFAVPAPVFGDVAEAYGPHARGNHIVLHAARGVGPRFVLPHQMIRRATCVRKIGVLGGPLYFADLEKKRPLFVALGSRYPEVFTAVAEIAEGTPVRLHTSRDVIGTEVAGAYSLVTALAVGMCETLDMGETAKGVLMARGLSEATKLGLYLGGQLSTFTGLAGVGDLIPRKVSSTERHHLVGAALATGTPIDEALRGVAGHVEGVTTAQEGAARTHDWGLRLPLLDTVAAVIDGADDVRPRLEALLELDLQLGAEVESRARW